MIIFDSGYDDNYDGPGTRLIFYLKGCNFRCDWCGAPESISPQPEILRYPERTVTVGHEITVGEIVRKARKARSFISGVTFGGGEPTLQITELLEALRLLREAKIHTAMESNASTPGFRDAAMMVDFLYADLKTLEPERFRHRVSPNVALLERCKDNLRFAARHQSCFTVRIPIVSGLNDDLPAQQKLHEFLLELLSFRPQGKFHVELLRQHHLAEPKYMALGRESACRDVQPPPRENLEQFIVRLRKDHINAVCFG